MSGQLKSTLLVLATAAVAAGQSYTYVGCFSGPPGNSRETQNTFQSVGLCQSICEASHQPVAALGNHTSCFCGNLLPPRDQQVGEDNCNLPCAGFDLDICGGDGFFSVYSEEPVDPEEPNGTQSRGAGAEATGVATPSRVRCSRGSRA
ncbi:hypothetical protein DL766_001931 [Monosporascus sp. MC13-8B]|uniref:WSC domain-containing protein n=1 Tax=Monosporascus cannonballus TaxID=155416 RepID=A0ABY0HMZ8_9PEZI|nr:hypothetical protein DL762_000459 [Monosporascus cannonballus]RYO96152.1 hypothetical protein DL763_003353 [Monosporascus cannonballus]RYP36555.1 hypothetical protein DL766_001931 [Monosporascus sp. MC13-8B]